MSQEFYPFSFSRPFGSHRTWLCLAPGGIPRDAHREGVFLSQVMVNSDPRTRSFRERGQIALRTLAKQNVKQLVLPGDSLLPGWYS